MHLALYVYPGSCADDMDPSVFFFLPNSYKAAPRLRLALALSYGISDQSPIAANAVESMNLCSWSFSYYSCRESI